MINILISWVYNRQFMVLLSQPLDFGVACFETYLECQWIWQIWNQSAALIALGIHEST